jgi:hypothetical protein
MAESDQLPAKTRPTSRRSLSRPQFLLHSLACCDVLAPCPFQRGKQRAGLGGVVPITLQVSDNFALPRNKLLAVRDMLLDLHQVLFDHCPAHLGYLRHGIG